MEFVVTCFGVACIAFGPEARTFGIILPLFGRALYLLAVFSLAARIYGILDVIGYSVVTLVPCASWVVLLMLNYAASMHLIKHGLNAGLFGVSPRPI